MQLTVTPKWTGSATVTDEIDGSPATLTKETARGFSAVQRQDFVAVTTQGTGIEAAIAGQLATSPNIAATPTEVDDVGQSAGQQITFPVSSGQSYTVTKYVGIDDSQDVADPVTAAQAEAGTAAAAGYGTAVAANDDAWAALWHGRVDVLGDSTLATDVNASEFYLWSSTRAGVDWSVSPVGLSSNGYDGHIFWDAETWMYPTLLAQHPDLAAAMESYPLRSPHRGAAARRHHRRPGRALPVGERPGRDRADPAPHRDQQRGPVRAAHHRRHRAGAVAVLPGQRRSELAGHAGVAGHLGRGHVLGRARHARRGRGL